MSQTAAAAAAVAAVVATEARWEQSAAAQDSQGYTPSELAAEISFGRLAALQDVIPLSQTGIPRPAGDVVKAWQAALDYAHQLTGGLLSSCAVVVASSSCCGAAAGGRRQKWRGWEGKQPWGQSEERRARGLRGIQYCMLMIDETYCERELRPGVIYSLYRKGYLPPTGQHWHWCHLSYPHLHHMSLASPWSRMPHCACCCALKLRTRPSMRLGEVTPQTWCHPPPQLSHCTGRMVKEATRMPTSMQGLPCVPKQKLRGATLTLTLRSSAGPTGTAKTNRSDPFDV